MTKDYDPRIARLPAWARSHIAALERVTIGLKTQLDSLTSGTKTGISWSVSTEPEHPIPDRATIRFENVGDPRDYIDCHVREGHLCLVAGSGRLRLWPEAANWMNVEVSRR